MAGVFALRSMERALEWLKPLLNFSSAPSSSSSSSQDDDLEELRKLERTLLRIKAKLYDAEKDWIIRDESKKLQLKELKELAFDMEDVVDEYEYEVNRHKVEALEGSAGVHPNKGKEYVLNLCKRRRHEEKESCSMDTVVPVPIELIHQARKITKKLDEIVSFSDRFTLSEYDGERRFTPDYSSTRHTSSFVSERSIIGRDREKDLIVEKLFSREGEKVGSPVSVMAIVGMGGLGKTTLAQLVYNNTRVRQSFDKFAWVYVSENFDVITITKNIINSLNKGRCENTELAGLHDKLVEEIKEKRVLLVLDDVWNDKRRDLWEQLCGPLSTTRICQIIITTRSKDVAAMVQAMPSHHPDHLCFDESWSLFKQVAFPAKQEHNTSANLITIGKRIVKKCNGLPLAVKTLGAMLRCETDQERWQGVLENELWELEQSQYEILPALELSYRHMPMYLRPCFLALSLFPKVGRVNKHEVMRLWKILELLPCDESDGSDEESDEDYKTGQLYFNELVQRSIFVHDSGYGDNHNKYYLLHDLIHGLSCFLAGEEFYRFEGAAEIPENVRFMSVPYYTPNGIWAGPSTAHPLRALIVTAGNIAIQNPEALFSNCKKLRALNLGYQKFPDCMHSLKLLRRLSFGLLGAAQFPFPSSISHLHNLQTLRFPSPRSWVLFPSGIGRLINLHTLPELWVNKCGCSFTIRELRNMNKIRKLSIQGLSNISRVKDAHEAQLQSKKDLRKLELGFFGRFKYCQCTLQPEPEPVTISHFQILESLQPHHNLIELSIGYYESQEYPCWLGNNSYSKLTRIELNSNISTRLPMLGGLPFLKYLKVNYMRYVEQIGREFMGHSAARDKGFASLTQLEFEYMLEWSEWSGVSDGDFPCLQTLRLYECPKLRSLPLVPSLSIVTSKLHGCHYISTVPTAPALRQLDIGRCSALRKLPTLPSLLELKLVECLNLSTVGYSFPELTTLTLRDCPKLSTVVWSLPSLSTMDLKGQLKEELIDSLLKDVPSLEVLEIGLLGVTCLPLKQQSLPSLTTLVLNHCPDLQYCNGLVGLTSLQYLEVIRCRKLSMYNLHPPTPKTLIHGRERRNFGY